MLATTNLLLTATNQPANTNIAAQEGRRITFDPRWFDPDSDETPEGVKPDVAKYS